MGPTDLLPPPTQGWVTVAEAAAICGVSTQAILKAIRTERLPAQQFARDAKRVQWMIRETDVEVFASSRTAVHVGPDQSSAALVETANTALHSLEVVLAESRGLRATVERLEQAVAHLTVERDRQVTLALDIMQQLDTARAETDRLRQAHAALVGAHLALLGTEQVEPSRR
jgi:hypothetical protein